MYSFGIILYMVLRRNCLPEYGIEGKGRMDEKAKNNT